MKRHLIIEGPDGAGKDTLIMSLLAYKHWPEPFSLHPRASTSLGGPVPDLSQWVAQDILAMDDLPPQIYNRHPLISEPIYSRYRKIEIKRSPEELALWEHGPWVHAMRTALAEKAVLVLCLPPINRVVATVAAQGIHAHMPGVAENISLIHRDYSRFSYSQGTLIRYDYTKTDVNDLVRRILQVRKYY